MDVEFDSASELWPTVNDRELFLSISSIAVGPEVSKSLR